MPISDFCIVWLERPISRCVLCSGEIGFGPVAWHRGNPIGPVCDECIIDAERGLGAVLQTVNLIRELAVDPATRGASFDRAAKRLMTWAYLYHRTEPWSVRPTALLEQMERKSGKPGTDLLRLIWQRGSNGDAQ